jgi:spore coat polysaccharide biosynthesis protein SpsF
MIRPRIVAIVQARMTSTRLPGKPLLKIGKKSLLQMMLDRIPKSATLSDVIVATSTLPESDEIEGECRRLGVRCFRGSENDVLSRFVAVARKTNADHIVRICGDEPFVDPVIIDGVVRSHLASRADYTSTALERTFPKGADVEVMTRRALLTVDAAAQTAQEREHVTLKLVNSRAFTKNSVAASPLLRMPELNLCIDTAQDLRFIRKVQEGVGYDASTKDIVAFFRQHKDIRRRPLTVFRADGGWRRGMGHISTGLALCQRLKKGGMDVLFLVRGEPEVIRTIEAAGYPVQRLDGSARRETKDVLAVLNHLRPELYVTDLLSVPQDYAPELRAMGIKTLSIDVLGTTKFTPDVIVNRSLAPERISKYSRSGSTKHFLGPQHAILGEAFAHAHRKKKHIRFPPKNIVLTFGGSDPKNLTVKALKAIERVPGDFTVTVVIGAAYKHQQQLEHMLAGMTKRVRVLRNIANMAEVLHAADAAISAGGYTLHELACTGTPALVMSLEPGQRVNAKEFTGYETIVDAGWGPDITVEKLTESIKKFLGDRAALLRMSKNGKKLVDGKGLERVLAVIRSLLR